MKWEMKESDGKGKANGVKMNEWTDARTGQILHPNILSFQTLDYMVLRKVVSVHFTSKF